MSVLTSIPTPVLYAGIAFGVLSALMCGFGAFLMGRQLIREIRAERRERALIEDQGIDWTTTARGLR